MDGLNQWATTKDDEVVIIDEPRIRPRVTSISGNGSRRGPRISSVSSTRTAGGLSCSRFNRHSSSTASTSNDKDDDDIITIDDWFQPATNRRRVDPSSTSEVATSTPLVSAFFQNIFTVSRHDIDQQTTKDVVNLDGGYHSQHQNQRLRWRGSVIARTATKILYKQMELDKNLINSTDFVLMKDSRIVRILSFAQCSSGRREAHVQNFIRGFETILGHSADERELFATNECDDIDINQIKSKVDVVHWVLTYDQWKGVGGTKKALETPSATNHDQYWFKLQYYKASARFEVPSQICIDPMGDMGKCRICQSRIDKRSLTGPIVLSQNHISIKGKMFSVNDAIFITSGTYKVENSLQKGYKVEYHPEEVDEKRYPEYYRYFDKGSNRLKGNYSEIKDPLQVGLIVQILRDNKLVIRSMLRPENVAPGLLDVRRSDLNLLFWTNDLYQISANSVEGKCVVLHRDQIPHNEPFVWAKQGKNRFYFEQSYSKYTKTFSPPTSEAISYRPPEQSLVESQLPQLRRPLRTLDLFAGSGGLSSGLEMAGCSHVHWAIENDPPTAKSFQLNHPDATVLNEDANIILRDLIDGKQGSFPPKDGVEMLVSGPPCQGYSGLNSFRDSAKSKSDSAMVAVCLSYLDFYRPQMFLMENVKTMFTYNSGLVMKLIVRAIVAMGYQVTVGVLQAGNHGVPQDRQRAFVLATSPFLKLPIFPEPSNVFVRSYPVMTVDKKTWTPNPNWKSSAPYRNVSAWEALSDLPRIQNGCTTEMMTYRKPPQSHFQKIMRWSYEQNFRIEVQDHICKEVSPITQVRISFIPTRPGADWRDLPNILWVLPDGTRTEKLKYVFTDGHAKEIGKYKGVCPCMSGPKMRCEKSRLNQRNSIIPWAMVHTARRNNHWFGCYGRVAEDSFFSTITTDPDPDGKQGRVLHYDSKQKRVFSVRELARGMGMSDSFRFWGNIKDKYRQIGNAVPPPLGEAIGLQIVEAIVEATPN